MFKGSPFIGHGFAATSRFEILKGSPASTLHGSLFDILAGLGLIGVTPWLLGIIWVGWRIYKQPTKSDSNHISKHALLRAELLALYSFLIVRASTSSGLSYHEKEFMIFIPLLAFASIKDWGMEPTPETKIDKLPENTQGDRILKYKIESTTLRQTGK